MPQFSIIIPVYRVEEYLEKCVDSILAQTCQDFELLLIDDGSPDGSGAICDRYAASHPNQVCALHQPNGGAGAARNRGIELAQGDYLLFVDGDDWLAPNLLEDLSASIAATPADLYLFGALVERDGKVTGELGRARGEVDQDRARLGAREQAVARQVEFLDLGGIAHHGKDDVGVRHGICRRIGPDGTALDKRGGLGLGAVVDRDGIAGIQDVAGDGGTHDSGADKCDGELVCHETFPFGLGVVTRVNTRCQRLGCGAPVIVVPAY